jgi:hypothetical protein
MRVYGRNVPTAELSGHGVDLVGRSSSRIAAIPRKYYSCVLNKFVFLMYQVGAGTSMFALGKNLSFFAKQP